MAKIKLQIALISLRKSGPGYSSSGSSDDYPHIFGTPFGCGVGPEIDYVNHIKW
jgi:hypothetical protein